MLFTVTLRVPMMIITQEKVFVTAICRKCYRCDAQAWERILESIESTELSSVSPCLTSQTVSTSSSFTHSGAHVPTYFLAHGSFAGVPAAAANAFGSKPLRFPRGALSILGI